MRAIIGAFVTGIALWSMAGASLTLGQTGTEPSDVVLVFDVSDSILESKDGTNVEFADALDGIADRVEVVASDLASGNAAVSFVVFGRTAIPYRSSCTRIELHEDQAAITRFEQCLRSIAAEYRAGSDAPVRTRINTTYTDHVAALVEAEKLLPATSSRAAVIFFTDGKHDPPGTSRDNEDVVARIAPAYKGRTPLAILPVGLGAGAGAFETELRRIYDAYFRDLQPCEGRASFSWPQVIFPSADAAGTAVALALQEVTCSFTVAPTPIPTVPPTPTPAPIGAPLGVRVLSSDRSLTIQWLPPSSGADRVTDYLARCTAATGGAPIESTEGVSTEPQTEVTGLQPGVRYQCEVAATDGTTQGPWSPASEAVVVLGIPGAPSQPRAEALDSAARLTVDPVTDAPVEQYAFECTDAAGAMVRGVGATPSVVVAGLTNGAAYTCVAYAESSTGRSPASPASASFSPCGGIFDCQPWTKFAVGGAVLAALLLAGWLFAQRYKRRARVWITAQVDGGENRPLGWGPELGIRLLEDEEGWYAAPLPPEGAAVRVRYRGENRFFVTVGTRIVDVHQGDATSVRDEAGELHKVILRRYRDQPGKFRAGQARAAADVGKPGRFRGGRARPATDVDKPEELLHRMGEPEKAAPAPFSDAPPAPEADQPPT
jgi:hypothetical protein